MAAAHRPDAPPVDDDRPGLRGLSLIAVAVAAEGVPADAAADVVYGAREVPAGVRRRLAAAGRPAS